MRAHHEARASQLNCGRLPAARLLLHAHAVWYCLNIQSIDISLIGIRTFVLYVVVGGKGVCVRVRVRGV